MKTIFTLIALSFISSAALAGEKYPSLTVTSTGEYVILIDGKRFNNERKISLKGLQKGKHYIDVFKKRKGLFGGRYKLVSSKEFEMGNKDLHIEINDSGYIIIGKPAKGWDGDYWWNNRDQNKRIKQ
ncbi:MAG TPA: hypothetical protein VJ765_15460 [Chitinophagaceae bacterium]|nr:hypothetical protein [Chitinophagaceae bacterium]